MVDHGYRLELTCDCDECQQADPEMHKFKGLSLDGAKKSAGMAGWKINANMTRCWAPDHYYNNLDFWSKTQRSDGDGPPPSGRN